MELNGISASVSPIPTSPIVPQAEVAPSQDEPEVIIEEEGHGKARGVISKLENGHFKGKGVSDIRLRIAHFDNPDLTAIDPEELAAPENGPTKAYEKFLEQYRALYEASLVPEEPTEETPPVVETDPNATTEPLASPDAPATETPEPVIIAEELIKETPLAAETDPIITEPLATPDAPATETPEPVIIVDELIKETPPVSEPVVESDGALTAFAETLDTVM